MILNNNEVQDLLNYLGKQPYEFSAPMITFLSQKIEEEKAESEAENTTNNEEDG